MSSIKLKHASGNSMAISAPPTNPASNLELKLPATIGTAGQVLSVDGSGNLTWIDPAQPSIIVDRYRYNTDTATSDQLLTAWDRNTDGNANRLPGIVGTGVTHSSGTFSFPSTGIWEVKVFTNLLVDGNEYVANVIIKVTSDGSNYNSAAYARGGDRNTGVGSVQNTHSCSAMFDITNTTNHKVQIHTDSMGATTVKGDADMDLTTLTFIRWGDT